MIKFENCSIDSVYAITVEAGASPVIHIGGSNDSAAYRSRSESSSRKKRCPLTVSTTQRTNWATKMSNGGNVTCPEGWETETFSSPNAFTGRQIPAGLTGGDAIFFWKSKCTDQSCPQGFEAVYLSEDGVMVIVPTSTSAEAEVDEEDGDLEEETPEEEAAIPPAPEIEVPSSTSVDESELEEED